MFELTSGCAQDICRKIWNFLTWQYGTNAVFSKALSQINIGQKTNKVGKYLESLERTGFSLAEEHFELLSGKYWTCSQPVLLKL